MKERFPDGRAGTGGPSEAAPAQATSWGEPSSGGGPRVGEARAVGSRGRDAARAEPGPAVRIGRYSVLRELGRGGMGVTYVAYDEELDRRVAIKLVRSDAMDEQAQTRLQREARALARLAHPNIVAVHDVGNHGTQAFIAMELVPGKTVNAWLSARPRPWTEVLSVFRQAAEGLSAAHAAGLVHRDVKPANIIVGDDGRVRVLDFGLAQLGGSDEGASRTGSAGAVATNDKLTDSGSLMGTLAYMAPEQLDRGVADARSDQFALCVSLFEALYRQQPFSGTTPRARLVMMRQGAISDVPESSPVPAWLHAVVVRGLAFDPDARWPSMAALLAALAHDPRRSRPRATWIAAAGAAALAGAAVAVGFLVAGKGDPVCTGAQAQIDEVWNQDRRRAIERAMLATGLPYAVETWERTAALLDRYATDWGAGHTDACEDTAVRAEQSHEVLDQRMQCLARRRRNLRALVGELARIDAASLVRATEAAGHLPPVSACADVEHLSSRIEPPADTRVATQVEALEADLSRAEQLQELGKYEEGRGVAQIAVELAAGLGQPAIEGRARLRLGALQLALGAYEAAEAQLKEAHLLARTAGDHEVALQAATQLVYLLSAHVSRLDDADDWRRHVQAELTWVSAETLQASALNTLGALAFLQSRHDEAIRLCRLALALWEQALGPEHPEYANALNNLGVMLLARGSYDEAVEHHRRALALRERALGREHPHVARSLNNLGGALYLQGKHAEAAQHYVRGLAITEQELDGRHPLMGDLLPGLALSYLGSGRPAEALPLAERALTLLESLGAGPGKLAEARFVLARALMATGRDPQRALLLAREARDVMQRAPGSLSLLDLGDVESWLRAHEPVR